MSTAERPTRAIAESRQSMAEIVGSDGLVGQRMQAGAILDLMDLVAGRVAIKHSGGRVATLSFDRVDLIYPILHHDLVRLDGQLVYVGQSSMVIDVRCYRKDTFTRAFMPIQRCFVTMVAVDDNGRPRKNVPALRYETPEEEAIREEALHHKALDRQWVAMQEATRERADFTAAEVEESFNREKQEFLTPAETEITVVRQFMPRNLNQVGTIFGGDVLQWMDRVATYTARHFTRNRNMVTIAMNRLFFHQPIFPTDLVEMKARVTYVRRFTLEVEIDVQLQRADGAELRSHSGYFTVLNYDESGFKRPIITGLRLQDDDQLGLRRYQQGKDRYYFWKEHQAPQQQSAG